ncbi:period circadian protein homolog 2 isoform X1 [Acanthochromis polyacanthus]|uniref:period circadian protein homolog 2 isoform X1 n=1 Tax=Acanthochromis polyacanthus TaxID=80966 RepID=UPI002234D487|nr:period circadian protein homolog 2 isoform X1 [Acanthochromis polyacanthus]
MSEDSDSKPYCFPVLEDQDGASGCRASTSCGSIPRGASGCSSMAQLHRMGGYSQGGPDLGLPSEGSDSSGQDPPTSPHNLRKNTRSRSLPEEDVEMKSSGSSGSGTESHGNESHGNESHGNESHGHESLGSSNGNSKDSALLESSESNKSSNSHSPSPPSSSNAFSLLSSEQDNPSTSGCSSEESAKVKTQKEVIKTLKELKLHLPAEKRHNNKSTTLNTLKYALRCVKQVEANEEYYQLLMINDSQPSGLDVSSYTIEEIDSITSEYTLKNNDIFAVAVSLITGRIVYISDQAASILNCKRDVFKNSKFVEFLTPQDVSVFYSFTTPYRLPSWSMCTGAESSPPDCMQEKSFFCRISGGKECKGDLQYYPFRMTPYLMKVQDTVHAEDQFCCLLLAERVHSGYDAPRIPTDKRIFTTTHTPSCVFQDVDERAVPLLGYLPQDLIGTPVLLHLHPNDRPIMLAIHRKILQYAGQPFDHSSIRFCARNGEYIILDTSWSSFVNPWSRKVSFVIGRHKVRMGPVNEDVFVAPASTVREVKSIDSDIQEITEQIHRLLLQPVHNSGSSGYGSMNSNDHRLGLTSSSESLNNGNETKMQQEEEKVSSKARPRTFQEICKGIHLQKSLEQQTAKLDNKKGNGIESVNKSPAVVRPKDSAAHLSWREAGSPMEESSAPFQEELAFNDQTVYSYQQISCLDSVIRYLESCNVPITMKRKCQSSSNTASSNSDEDKQKGTNSMQVSEEPTLLKDQSTLSALDDQDKKSSDAATAVVGTSLPLPVPNKPESVVSITSQCSYSSTIVHVGDKKPQPESEIIEDVAGAGETAEPSLTPGVPPCAISPPSQERESYKKLGLTKQVLAAHTQKEEQAFLCRFRELRGLASIKANCSEYLERQRELIASDAPPAARPCKQGAPTPEPTPRRGTRNKKTKSKRAKQIASSDSTASHHRQQQLRPPLLNHGLNQTSWSTSEASQSTFPMAYPAMVPGYPLQVYSTGDTVAPPTDAPLQGFGDNQGAQAPPCPPSIQAAPFTSPIVTPIVALVLPNYLYPLISPAPPPPQPVYHTETGGFPAQTAPFVQAAFPGQGTFTYLPSFSSQNQLNPQNHFASQTGFVTSSVYCPPSSETPKPPVEGQSRSSTPQTGGAGGQTSPPLFQSRCSSPLNLLELELSVDRQDSTVLSSGGQVNNTAEREKGTSGNQAKERELKQPSLSLLGPPGPLYFGGTPCVCERLSWDKVCSRLRACSKETSSRGDGNNSDANSSSSDMLDIILQEDSCSGTGSATSGSMGSRSNGCGTSASGTSKSRTSASGTSASGTGSNNSSKYFGSVDSSQNSQKVKGHSNSSEGRSMEMEQSEHFIKYVLQDPMWLLMANTDEKVMMTYQLPSRDIQKVLREDKEKLRLLQKNQPRFTEEQKKELIQVHPWMKKGGLPKAVDVKMCPCCESNSEAAVATVEDQPDLDLGDTETEEVSCQQSPTEEPSSTAVISCHGPSPGSGLQTQPARQ